MVRVLALFVLILAGCGSASPACRVGADCASGACRADGQCEPMPGRRVDADGADGVVADAESPAPDVAEGTDEGPDPVAPDSTPAEDAGPVLCTQDNDGVITRAEVPLAAGLHATFKVALDTDVSTTGTLDGAKRTWDLSAMLPGDHGVLLETQPLTGKWFAADFAGATYAAKLSDTADVLGVFEVTDTALFMRGIVSPDDGLLATKLTYDPPVKVLVFPLKAGATWKTVATVTGTTAGVLSYFTETYESQVDAAGTVVTPYGSFQALRVRVTLDRLVGLLATRVRSFLFVAECFGTVATVTSKDNEADVEFTAAAEVRRLAP